MAEEKKTPAKAGTGKAIPALRVVAKREGFRRAGYEFGGTAKDIPLAELDKEQVKQLKGDPSLVCVEVGIAATEVAE